RRTSCISGVVGLGEWNALRRKYQRRLDHNLLEVELLRRSPHADRWGGGALGDERVPGTEGEKRLVVRRVRILQLFGKIRCTRNPGPICAVVPVEGALAAVIQPLRSGHRIERRTYI